MVEKSYYDVLKEAGDELARLVDENRANVQGVNDWRPWALLLEALDAYRSATPPEPTEEEAE